MERGKETRRTHLRLVTTESSVSVSQTLQPDRELDVARSDDVLNLELGELGVEAELLDDSSVPEGGGREGQRGDLRTKGDEAGIVSPLTFSKPTSNHLPTLHLSRPSFLKRR